MKDINSDYWMPENFTFVTYNRGYQITKTLRTVCVGEITPTDNPPDATSSQPGQNNGVAKIEQVGLPINTTNQEGIMQPKKRGRPRKLGPVHRSTKFRRAKQGILSL